MALTQSQEEHLRSIKETFARAVDSKYRRGAEEHAGDLRDRTPLDLIEEAIAENIDQFTFLVTARDKLLFREQLAIDVESSPIGFR